MSDSLVLAIACIFGGFCLGVVVTFLAMLKVVAAESKAWGKALEDLSSKWSEVYLALVDKIKVKEDSK